MNIVVIIAVIIVVTGIAACVAVVLLWMVTRLRAVFRVVVVNGPSMMPALSDGDRVLVRRTRCHGLRRGDIALADLTGLGDLAGRGDLADMADLAGLGDLAGWTGSTDLKGLAGRADLAGRTDLAGLAEQADLKGLAGQAGWTGTGWVIKRIAALPGDPAPPGLAGPAVPAGMVALLGDNPPQSLDSRDFGYVPVDRLYGVVVRKL